MGAKARRSSAQAIDRAGLLLDGGEALASLEQYFAGRFTGAWFDAAGRRSDPATGASVDHEPNRLTVEDLLAPSLLGTPLEPRQMVDLFQRNRGLDHLFGRLDRELSIAAAPSARDLTESPWGAASEAYWLLRTVRGVGRTRASKIMARKRPHLVPVWDRDVAAGLGLKTGDDHWAIVQEVAIAHHDRLEDLRAAMRSEHHDDGRMSGLSLLRTLDVVVWMRMRGASMVEGGDALKLSTKALAKGR